MDADTAPGAGTQDLDWLCYILADLLVDHMGQVRYLFTELYLRDATPIGMPLMPAHIDALHNFLAVYRDRKHADFTRDGEHL